MSTVSDPNSERPLDPPRNLTEAEIRRRAECAERISRLLSALEGGPSTGKTQYLTKEEIRETKINPDSDTSPRFLLPSQNGAKVEFQSLEDAGQRRSDLQHDGASIIGVEKKPLEPTPAREQTANPPTNPPANLQANPPAMITGGLNSSNRSTSQESKKADDPDDSHPNSPPQTNTLPANSKVMRVVGKIFPAADKTLTLNACPPIRTNCYELLVLGNSNEQFKNEVDFGNLTLTCAPQAPNYGTINIHYTTGMTKASNRA